MVHSPLKTEEVSVTRTCAQSKHLQKVKTQFGRYLPPGSEVGKSDDNDNFDPIGLSQDKPEGSFDQINIERWTNSFQWSSSL